MRKFVLVVSGVVASVVAAVLPNGTVDGLPISPHSRNHTQGELFVLGRDAKIVDVDRSDETPSGIEASDIYVLDAIEIEHTIFIPVIVIPDEPFEDFDSSTTVSATTYAISSLSKAANPTAIPTGGAGFTYSVRFGTAHGYANATKPAKICTKAGTARVTPTANRLLVPSLGLYGSAISVSNGSKNLPGISTSTGSYRVPKPSELPTSYSLPKPPPLLSQSTPGIRNPFRQLKHLGQLAMDRVTIGMLTATFLTITGTLISLL